MLGAKAPPVDGVTETSVIPLPRIPAYLATGEWTLRTDDTLLLATDGVGIRSGRAKATSPASWLARSGRACPDRPTSCG